MPRPDPPNGESRKGSPAGGLALEVSALQARLLGQLHEMEDLDGEAFASAAQQLAKAFGFVTAALVEPLAERLAKAAHGHHSHPALFRRGEMRRRLEQLLEAHRRYGHPFGLVVFDVEGPGARNGSGGEDGKAVRETIGAALRDSTRLLDETFPLEETALCVLVPNQNTVGCVRMAERLQNKLEELEGAGGLSIQLFAGVVACPEHGADAETLLHKADEAMWRARAVGEPVGVGSLQDR